MALKAYRADVNAITPEASLGFDFISSFGQSDMDSASGS